MWLLLLQLAAVAVTGRVVSPGGAPIEGATVHVYVCPRGPDHCDAVRTTLTDATGTFAVEGDGTVRIEAMRHFEEILEPPLPATFVLTPIPPPPWSVETLRRFGSGQNYGDCVGHYVPAVKVRVERPTTDERWDLLDTALLGLDPAACRVAVSMYPRNPDLIAATLVDVQMAGGRLSVTRVDPVGLFPEQITCMRAFLDGLPIDERLSGLATIRVCR